MLTTLRLYNFVLIEACEVDFEKNLNILTGETGAGKTILIQAIALLMGQKAESSMVRSGAEKAVIEACFKIERLTLVHDALRNGGISFEVDEELIIKREIAHSGKNRIFINAQLATRELLLELGTLLFETAGQNTSVSLHSLEKQRHMLDVYADLIEKVSVFTEIYHLEKSYEKNLSSLYAKKEDFKRQTEKFSWELEELESLAVKEGEDETLFEEYRRLNSHQEISEKLSPILEGLPQIAEALSRYKRDLSVSRSFEEPITCLDSSIHLLNETSYFLSRYLDETEVDPKKLETLENRLSAFNQIKKKFHLDPSEIPLRVAFLKKELHIFNTIDEQIEEIQKKLIEARKKRESLALELTEKRGRAAQKLENDLTRELRLLKMPDALCEIQITAKELGPEGADTVSFYLAANLGEKPAAVKGKTSGGELARLFFALKLLLAEREAIPTLIFDEIDSNIGGETATLFGEKLKTIAEHRQVLCITHFPQVAHFASRHLHISKQTDGKRTFTTIKALDQETKQAELLRMMGGKHEAFDFLRR